MRTPDLHPRPEDVTTRNSVLFMARAGVAPNGVSLSAQVVLFAW